jgi:hypothetical protein
MKSKNMSPELAIVNRFITSLKGVEHTDLIKEDDASFTLELIVRAAIAFFCCQDIHSLFRYSAFFSSDNRAYHPNLPVQVF